MQILIRRLKVRALLVAIGGTSIFSPRLSAQANVVQVDGRPSQCAGCGLEVRRIVTLGKANGAGPGEHSRVAWTSSGGYVVVVEPGPQLFVYDSAGRFSGRLAWQPQQPGEPLESVVPRVNEQGMISVLDGSRIVQFQTLVAAPTTMLFAKRYGDFESTTVPLAVPPTAIGPHATQVDLLATYRRGSPEIAVTSSFAADSVSSSEACGDCPDLLVTSGLRMWKSYVWVASSERYEICLMYGWGSDLLQTLAVGNSPWFPAATTPRVLGRALPASPRLFDLAFDPNSALWVVGLVATPESSAPGADVREESVVDVIGLDTVARPADQGLWSQIRITDARVVASTRLPGRLRLLGPSYGYMTRKTPDGEWVIDVYRLLLRN